MNKFDMKISNGEFFSKLRYIRTYDNVKYYIFSYFVLILFVLYKILYEIIYITDYSIHELRERFNEDDVESAFTYLIVHLDALWSKVDIEILKRVCMRDIRLPHELKSELKVVTSLEELLDCLVNFQFCNWMELTLLKRMAVVVDIPKSTQMISVFEECVHRRSCCEVMPYFRKQYIMHWDIFEKILKNKGAYVTTVANLMKEYRKMEPILQVPKSSKGKVLTFNV